MQEAVLERVQPATKQRTPFRPFAKWPVLSIAGLLALVHLAMSPFGGYWIDEVYMLAAGKYHLDWGYVDQPPLGPLLAAAMDWIAPGSLVALRLPAVLATAGGVVVAALLARELGGDRRAQILAAGAFATGLWSTLVGHWVTPYTLEPPLWMVLCWLLIRWIRLRSEGTTDDRLLLAAGVVAGVTAETKFQVFVLAAALLLSALVFGPRDLLRRPMFWAAAALAALIAAPTLIWQAVRGWPQLQMGAVVAAESPVLSGGRIGTTIGIVVYAGVIGGGFFLAGLWHLLFSREFRAYRFLGVTTVLLFVFFVATAGRPYYLTGMYGVVTAAAVVGFQRRHEARPGRTWGWLAWPALGLSAAAAAWMMSFSTVLPASFGISDTESIARTTAEAYHKLPATTRAHTAIVGDNYIVSAIIDVYSPRYHLPTTYSPHRGYGYFGPPTEQAQSVLYLSSDPALLRPYFTEIRPIQGHGDQTVWLCSGKRQPWTQIWPRVMNL